MSYNLCGSRRAALPVSFPRFTKFFAGVLILLQNASQDAVNIHDTLIIARLFSFILLSFPEFALVG